MRIWSDSFSKTCVSRCGIVLMSLVHVVLSTVSNETAVTCKRWPNVEVTSGSTWTERCRRCRCKSDGQTECVQPKCPLAYHPYQEDRCIKWSPDSCCCQKLVCRLNGQTYNIGDKFPLNEGDPCMLCTCKADPGVTKCEKMECFDVGCVNPAFMAGRCCHLCPTGLNCRLPPLDWPVNGKVDTTEPVPFNTTRIIFSEANPRYAWSCTCKTPGSDAECSRQARLSHMRFWRYGHP
ncbi:cysteine-rich motor neuron 1 protein-like [Haliotis cracherodii]|uniref:cysteine-rich motor neuron 1 protein-like n=1 Tax=Haliotis cracherodii TaxID=6455 RepID=UPI0039EB9BE2